MISALYMEEAVCDHPRTRRLRSRFPNIPHIVCDRYGEVFNRRGQDFRIQKKRPALILARKHQGHVLPTPPGYGIGGTANYYFSHVLNCLYDCRYCFLQGLYQSANYVLFVNYEDFQAEMDLLLQKHGPEKKVYFFSGYDGDSFALESLSEFVSDHLDFFRDRPRAVLELRSKSLQAKKLESLDPIPNVVVAFSLTPDPVSEAYEHGVPPLPRRLALMERLAERGWPIGLRFDPLIAHEGFEAHYHTLLETVFEHLSPTAVHSASLGLMRFPRAMHKKMARLYPEEPLLAANLQESDGQVTNPRAQQFLASFQAQLEHHLPRERIFPCT